MLNLTYDEQGSNGRESYDPRPELNPPALIRHSDKAPDTLWVTAPKAVREIRLVRVQQERHRAAAP